MGEHNRPPIVDEIEKKYSRKLKDGGVVFVGDKGILVAGNYCEGPRLVPEEKQRQFPGRQDAAAGAEGPDPLHRFPPRLQGRGSSPFAIRLRRPA